jgi:hypothetical protein
VTPLSINDKTFLDSIKDDKLRQKYLSLVKSVHRKSRIDKRNHRQRCEREIEEMEKHDAYVNAVESPFIQANPIRDKLGYRLHSCDPFFDRGWKNFDCLAYKINTSKIILLFVEVKTAVSSPENIING